MVDNKKTLLIVEDDMSLLRALVNKFINEGFNTLEAKNGEEGLSIALQKKPDLILSDIVMPRMDGLSMLKAIRKDEWGASVPTIILTNLEDVDKTEEALSANVYDFLIKSDWKLEDLVKKVKDRLGE